MKEAIYAEHVSANVRKINPDGVLRYLTDAGDMDDSTIAKIARAFGIGCGDVLSIIRRNKLDEKLEDCKMTKINEERAIELYKQGLSDAAIAKEFGVEGSTVYFWRKRRGFASNHVQGGQSKTIIPEVDDLEPDQDESRPPVVKELPVPVVETPAPKPATINQDWEKAVNDMMASRQPVEAMPVIEAPDTDELMAEIEAMQEEINQLLIKNAELLGFAEGMKWALSCGRLAG